MLQVLKLSKRSTVSTENSIDLSTTNKVVTVAVYSTTPFDMLAKVVDGGLSSRVSCGSSSQR
jgi:hypothetical protein